MVRTSPWPTVLGTAALIALPVLAAAQTGSTGTQSAQPTAQSDRAYPSTAGAATQHLTEAKQVLDSIPRNAVTGRNAARMNDIRRHFAALQRTYSANPTATAGAKTSGARKGAASVSGNWNTHLMALDRELSVLLGASGSATAGTAAGSPSATGTSGTPAGTPSARGSATASGSLNPDVRSKLEEFRSHITEFAAAASGTSASGTMSSSATETSSSMTGTAPTTTTPTEPTTPNPANPTTSSSSNPAQTGSATGETAQSQSTQTGTSASGSQADSSAARQHLTEARQSLADLTALPQAQQLQGDARTQVSQLISQFNQLITSQADWKASYAQVNTTLTSLLGESSAASASSSTSGAVGTSGSASASGTIDPAVRSKLVEFRTHLQAFYTAAGGEGAGASSMSSMSSTSSTGSMSSAPSSDVESHVAAIERILDQAGGGASTSSSATGSTGSAGAMGSASSRTSASVTLTQEQIDQIRMHLQAIRAAKK